MLLALLFGKLHVVVEIVHADEFGKSLFAPDQQRNVVLYRGADRKGHNAGVIVPGDVADLLQHIFGEPQGGSGRRREPHQVAVELLDEIGQIANPERRIERVIVTDEKRIETEFLLDHPSLIGAVLAAGDGDDAIKRIILGALAGLIFLEQFLERLAPCRPVDLVHEDRPRLERTAAGTHAFFVEHDSRLRIGGVAAALTVVQGVSSVC